jgi:hypothetical protein
VPLNKVWFLKYFCCLYLFLYRSYRLYTYLFITSLVHNLQFIVHRIFINFHINTFTPQHYNNSEYLATGRYGTGVLPLRGRWDTSCGNCFHNISYSFTPSLDGALLLLLLSLLPLLSLLFTGGTGVYLYGGRGMSPLPPVCENAT